MKTNLFISAICLLTGIFFFSACDDDDKGDMTPPVISLVEPEEGVELLIGGEHGVHLEMDLTDDVELKSYRVNIHSNFDHHGHTATKATDKTIAFSFDKVYDDATGKKNHHVHNHDIVIPANATPGDYHLMIYCTDAAKNESYIARNIKLSRTAEDDHDIDE